MKLMKNSLLVSCLLAAVLAGCLGPEDDTDASDAGVGTDAWADWPYHPTIPSFNNTLPDTISGFDHIARLIKVDGDPWPVGNGNWVQGDLVFGSAGFQSFFIADISDPEQPRILYAPEDASESDTPYARKAEVVTHPDGRMTLALATQTQGMHLWDVSDPENPVWASDIPELDPNHYVSMVPGLEIVMNNPSQGEGSTNEFVDVSDPYNPVILGSFGDVGCHGTVFLNEYGHDKFRGYCAGIDRTEIWDMTGWDPNATDLGIKVLGVVDELNDPVAGNPLLNQHPLRSLHHLAAANADGTILIIGDEHNGGGSPGACFLNDPTTGLSTPIGALWFYDISDESNPELLSWISPPTVEPRPNSLLNDPTNPWPVVPSCTAHFGEVIEDRDQIVIAWYNAGVLLIDFSDPSSPFIQDQWLADGMNTWSARYNNGYVFTGDLGRGMDVLQLV